jgi:hypothetical protein
MQELMFTASFMKIVQFFRSWYGHTHIHTHTTHTRMHAHTYTHTPHTHACTHTYTHTHTTHTTRTHAHTQNTAISSPFFTFLEGKKC